MATELEEILETPDKLLAAQQETNRLMTGLLAIAKKWEARFDERAEQRRQTEEERAKRGPWQKPMER